MYNILEDFSDWRDPNHPIKNRFQWIPKIDETEKDWDGDNKSSETDRYVTRIYVIQETSTNHQMTKAEKPTQSDPAHHLWWWPTIANGRESRGEDEADDGQDGKKPDLRFIHLIWTNYYLTQIYAI